MNNILFCSAGRRGKLIEDFKETINDNSKIIVAENSIYAPARYLADKSYSVPKIDDIHYIDNILEICEKEQIKAVFTLIDPEIEVLAKNRKKFEDKNIILFVPSENTARICFDKYEMYKYLVKNKIKTVLTFENIDDFKSAYNTKKISFPVFVKPKNGSGSVGARKINTLHELEEEININDNLIIQEYMDGIDLDADVYIDAISKEPVAMFSKRKIETKIGGANKTISFKDEKLFDTISNIVRLFEFCGPIDMDFFYKDGEYYLSEINPRFGGAYLHAYGAGVNFPKLIYNNINNKENVKDIGNYEENIVMLMW